LQALATAAGRATLCLEVLAVNVSAWDSAIEGPTTSAPVRLGFLLLRGIREDVAGRIELARAARPFVDVADLARRADWLRCASAPSTANGVLFMTLEDETGQVNVILWSGLLEKFRKEVLGAALLAVYGVWQAEGKMRQLIASKLVDRTELLGAPPTTSREFCWPVPSFQIKAQFYNDCSTHWRYACR